MSIKRKDTPESRAYWDFVERVAKEARHSNLGFCTECNCTLNELTISTIRGLCTKCAPAWAREVIIG